MKKIICIALFCCLCTVISNAVSEDCNDGTNRCVRQHQPVVVSATRWETTGIPTASSISIITREQIIASGASRLADLLRGQGGVQLQDLYGDGSRTTVGIRGFGENAGANTLVLVDGRRLNNTDLKSPDLGFISIKDIERIEIIQGSAAVLFGDQAVGGVINIITKKVEGLELSAEAGLGSYGLNKQVIRLANRFDNGTGVRVSAERREADNFRVHNDLSYDNLFANLDYTWEKGRAFVEYLHVDEDLETPGALFRENLAISRSAVRQLGAMDFNDTVSDSGRAGITFMLDPAWEFAAEYTHRNEDVDGCLVFCTPFSQHRLARAFNPRIRGKLPLFNSNLQIIAGADIENTEYKLISGVGDTVNDQDMHSVYGLFTIPVHAQFSFTGGIRYAEVENDNFIRDPFTAPFPLLTRKQNTDEQVAWSAGVVYTPRSNLRLFIKGERVFRFPLADELSGTATPASDLQTQTGYSYETGFEWQHRTLDGKVSVFYLDLEDEIAFDPNAGVFGANINFDPTRRIGSILELNWYPLDNLHVGGQYTFTHARFDSGPYDGNRIPLVADHQLQANATWHFYPQWSLYGEVFLISDRVAGADLEDTFPHLPGYGVSNIHLRYDNDSVSISGKINNLFDKEYSDFAATGFNENIGFALDTGYYPAPGRTFMLTLGWQY